MSLSTIDLNADLGEGFPFDDALFEIVTSASIACGGHAGDVRSMRRALRSAAANEVRVGAHPGYPDPAGFGRKRMVISAEELAASLVDQVETLCTEAGKLGLAVTYLKPHGALYHDATSDPTRVGALLVDIARKFDLALLLAPTLHRASARDVRCFTEGFADRRYLKDGRLADRSAPEAVLTDPTRVVRQAVALARRQNLLPSSGKGLILRVDSICVHGDTPRAVELATAIRAGLAERGTGLRSFLA